MAVVKVQFANSDLEVISSKDDSGELWMLANPFARILEYSKANDAIRQHVSHCNSKNYEEIRSRQFVATHVTSSSVQAKSKFINRAGLFELIQASRMPKAQEFRDWINSDLLPKLCDDGKYDMAVDAPIEIAHGMNAVHVATNDGAEAPWLRDLSELKQVIVKKDELIAIKDEENKKLTVALQDANQSLAVANNALITLSQNMSQALVMVNEARIDSENARKETAQLANRMADIAQDVIAKPSDPELLHSLAVCALGGDQYAFVRPQKRSLKRTLNRLSVDDSDIVFKRDYVPNSMNVLNKVKENLPKDKYKARHNKITLLEDLTKEDLVEAINASLTQRQVAIIANKAQKL
ncbi:BRO [Pseudalatia unipuncta granulovirus]|jgi:prophage antirepressor-like protein|uniref:BRO n=1 Tax=Pseudalatia unipuncta granulosis virus TaxID=36355 RepID=B6S736_GVPU|nr:BRO [Pseudalatia unipuncta granulovirus]ACH69517.1 BRO [Pseudalatia unipuncta granulovirus]